MKHVHHDMIIEWAKDTSRVIQRRELEVDPWQDEPYPHFFEHVFYRFKPAEPKFIVVNGVNVQEPMREPLEHDQMYWLADPTQQCADSGLWTATKTEIYWRSLGLIHLTREAAQAHIDAMLLPSRTDK